MKRFFRNIPWRNVLIITLVAVLGIGAIAGISTIAKNDKKTISSVAFKRGALNDLGFYVESDQSIYTKDLIECQGLEIEPDFETLGTYQVFYYDCNKLFMGKTDKINSQTDGVYVKGDSFGFAQYCRIVITPAPETDEDGNVDEDFKIAFYEVASYANKYKITVNKDQKEIGLENFFEGAIIETSCSYEIGDDGYATRSNVAGVNCVTLRKDYINSKSIELVYDVEPGNYTYLFINKTNKVISSGEITNDILTYYLTIPEDTCIIVIHYDDNSIPAIYRAS